MAIFLKCIPSDVAINGHHICFSTSHTHWKCTFALSRASPTSESAFNLFDFFSRFNDLLIILEQHGISLLPLPYQLHNTEADVPKSVHLMS